MQRAQIEDRIYQALETEMGGIKVYKTSLAERVQSAELRKEWEECLEQTG